MLTSRAKGAAQPVSCLSGISKHPARVPAIKKQYASISAKYKGPGLGKYGRQPLTGIKDHDFTKYAEPAYTMRVKSSERLLTDPQGSGVCLGSWQNPFSILPPSSHRVIQCRKGRFVSCQQISKDFRVVKKHTDKQSNSKAFILLYWPREPAPTVLHVQQHSPLNKLGAWKLCQTAGERYPGPSHERSWGHCGSVQVPNPAPKLVYVPAPQTSVFECHLPGGSATAKFGCSQSGHERGQPDRYAEATVAADTGAAGRSSPQVPVPPCRAGSPMPK
ncbi:Uncharacterized protein PODLI_1B018339, partial [Podarcis lilfordi]